MKVLLLLSAVLTLVSAFPITDPDVDQGDDARQVAERLIGQFNEIADKIENEITTETERIIRQINKKVAAATADISNNSVDSIDRDLEKLGDEVIAYIKAKVEQAFQEWESAEKDAEAEINEETLHSSKASAAATRIDAALTQLEQNIVNLSGASLAGISKISTEAKAKIADLFADYQRNGDARFTATLADSDVQNAGGSILANIADTVHTINNDIRQNNQEIDAATQLL